MKRVLFIVEIPVKPIFFLFLSAFSANASECPSIENDLDRLACYDAAIKDPCKIEDWNYRKKGKYIQITGATTCREGRLAFRIYDKETSKFVTSDFTYIKGYVFDSYSEAGYFPKSISLKYVID